jgi:site-specific DNA-methyltransferase (adenine-specific)
MSRTETIAEGITLHLGDCREILPTLGKVDAVVTDPPYGLGDKWQGGKAKWPLHHQDGMKWDAETCAVVLDLPNMARELIVWGGHLYGLAPKSGWLVWDKIIRKFTSGVMEFAWTTLDQPIKAFNYAHGELASEGKVHPTQKPLPLMRWCIEQLPDDCETIVDPFMGSGTTGVAAALMGRKFIGIGIEPKYFDIACKRIEGALKQGDMFIEKPKPAKQVQLI